MSRAKLSEYRAKVILGDVLGVNYSGIAINTGSIDNDRIENFIKRHGERYVLKVDQAAKRRGKLGLLDLNVTASNVYEVIKKYADLGYEWLLIEPFLPHEEEDERFIAMELTEQGIDVAYSNKGGVDIESHADSIQRVCIESEGFNGSVGEIPQSILKALLTVFERQHLTYLEINPFVVTTDSIRVLDAAFEVDTSAVFFADKWTSDDLRNPMRCSHEAEKKVEEVASKSPASLNLKVLNPDGSIFLLLSGGGASVVVFDELSACDLQDRIANYGEYSGNPNEEETYLYTTQIIKLILGSEAQRKILLIAGGVANFTDIHHTFKGIVRALAENIDQLHKQGVAVVVRRGGPNQKRGLAYIKEFLDKEDITNEVYDPSTALSQAVAKVAEAVR